MRNGDRLAPGWKPWGDRDRARTDGYGPPDACADCGRSDTVLLSGDACSGCLPVPDRRDVLAAAQAAATRRDHDLYVCGDWTACLRDGRVMAVHDAGHGASFATDDARDFDADIAGLEPTDVPAGQVQAPGWQVLKADAGGRSA